MSQAFVKEGDEQWLHEVSPTINALIVYLIGQNNGIRVKELKTEIRSGKEIFHMSNGLSYAKDVQGVWGIVE
jgi:hypothetical protein